MQRTALKTKLVGLTIATLAVMTGGLSACSNTSQTTAPTSSGTFNTSDKPLDHSSMNHGGTAQDSRMSHSTGMNLGPADAEFDLRFIDAMTPHHQGAVEMAKVAQQQSKRPEIQKLAAEIIGAQDQEIAQMKQWRQAWYPKASAEPVAYHPQMGHSMPMSPDQRKSMMMNMNLGAADNQFDLRLINAMIPHHESAVLMANAALKNSKRPEVQKLAQDIIRSQEAEINQMKQWRKAWYNQ
jgi:uncharacterized protein (DUF305 family)